MRTDCDPLRLHPEVAFRFIGPGQVIPPTDLIILPGSKAVRADLAWLRDNGWEHAIQRHLRYGGKVIGICGGLQMLGSALHDQLGLEGSPGSTRGLGLIDLETTLATEKQLRNVSGTLALPGGAKIRGYEIHMGVSRGPALARPSTHLDGRADGVLSDDDRILASYVHGLFDLPDALAALLAWASPAGDAPLAAFDLAARRDSDIDRLADVLEQHLNWKLLAEWLPVMRD